MNYKSILITAIFMIALCSPAFAAGVWRNDNFYTDEQYAKISEGCNMVHDSQSEVDSCYRDNNPAKSVEVYVGANTCTLEGNVRAGYNTLTKEVELRNVNQSANKTAIIIPIQPDGTFRYDGLAQGDYILKITPQFEGLGPEQISTVHCTNGVARPSTELLGFAVSASPSTVCSREILDVDYCWDYVPEVSHMEYRSCKVIDWYWDWSAWKKVYYCGEWNNWKIIEPSNCKYTLPVGFGEKYCKKQKVIDTPAQDGGCDTSGEPLKGVREVVANGHLSFIFDHRPGAGSEGILDIDGTTILYGFKDPAENKFKHVTIDYKDCNGMEQHVSTEEYEVINL